MPYADPREQRAFQADWARTRTQLRRAQGKCIQCGRRSGARSRCDRCRRARKTQPSRLRELAAKRILREERQRGLG